MKSVHKYLILTRSFPYIQNPCRVIIIDTFLFLDFCMYEDHPLVTRRIETRGGWLSFWVDGAHALSFLSSPRPSARHTSARKAYPPLSILPARAPSHADTSRAGFFTPRSLVDSFVPTKVGTRSFVRSFVPACVRALFVILPRYPRTKKEFPASRSSARCGVCATRSVRNSAGMRARKLYASVSGRLARGASSRNAPSGAKMDRGAASTKKMRVHLAVLGLARLRMGKQTDGWVDVFE